MDPEPKWIRLRMWMRPTRGVADKLWSNQIARWQSEAASKVGKEAHEL